MNNKKTSREEKTDKLAKMWEDGWEEWPPFEIEIEEEDEEEEQEEEAPQQGKRRISEYLHKDGKHAHGHNHGQRRMIAA